MKIALGSDHVGFPLKQIILSHLEEAGHEVRDFGAHDRERCDYPVHGELASRAVASGDCDRGIVICGTGIGISIAANKVRGIRAALCCHEFTARLTREHNDSNVLALGAEVVGKLLALAIVDTWLATPFSGIERHQKRIDQISAIEAGPEARE